MATTLFAQPPDLTPTLMGTAIDQNMVIAGATPPRMMLDDFTLGSPSSITSINFWGYFWMDSLPKTPPDELPIIHMEIFLDAAGAPGAPIWSSSAPPIGDFGPAVGPAATLYIETSAGPIAPGFFFDPTAPVVVGNPVPPPTGTSVQWKYACPIPPGVLSLPAGAYWLGIQVDLSFFSSSTSFGWANTIFPGPPAGSPVAFSPVSFLTGGPGVAGALLYPPGHPLAGSPLDMAFELDGGPTGTTTPPGTTTPSGTTAPPTTAPPTTAPPTTAPPTTAPPTTAPPTTAPGGTTTGPGGTTVPPPTTTPPSAAVPHPADSTIGGLSGDSDFRISSTEILAYASAFLGADAAKFPGVTVYRSAYVLRAAAIFLANFQARYKDVGTAAPVDDPAHPARWQEMPDI